MCERVVAFGKGAVLVETLITQGVWNEKVFPGVFKFFRPGCQAFPTYMVVSEPTAHQSRAGKVSRGVAWLRTVMQLGLFTFLPFSYCFAQNFLLPPNSVRIMPKSVWKQG